MFRSLLYSTLTISISIRIYPFHIYSFAASPLPFFSLFPSLFWFYDICSNCAVLFSPDVLYYVGRLPLSRLNCFLVRPLQRRRARRKFFTVMLHALSTHSVFPSRALQTVAGKRSAPRLPRSQRSGTDAGQQAGHNRDFSL
jgi:hypothetical protein